MTSYWPRNIEVAELRLDGELVSNRYVMTEPELKPCPFCGSAPVEETVEGEGGNVKIRCMAAGCHDAAVARGLKHHNPGVIGEDRKWAVGHWNRVCDRWKDTGNG